MNAKKRKGFLTLVLLLLFAFFSFTPAVSAASSVVSKGTPRKKLSRSRLMTVRMEPIYRLS